MRNIVKCRYSFFFLLSLSLSIPCFHCSHIQVIPCFTHSTSTSTTFSFHLLLSFLCASFSTWSVCSLLSISAILHSQLCPIQSSCQCDCPFCNQFDDSLCCQHPEYFCPFSTLYILTSSSSFSLAACPHLSPDLSPPPQCQLLTSCSPFTTQPAFPPSLHQIRAEQKEQEMSPLQQRRVKSTHTFPIHLEASCHPLHAQGHFPKSEPEPSVLRGCLCQLCSQSRLLQQDAENKIK